MSHPLELDTVPVAVDVMEVAYILVCNLVDTERLEQRAINSGRS